MRLLILILIIHYTMATNNSLSSETMEEIKKLNEMKYSHEHTVNDEKAEFSFTIHNITYAQAVLGIQSYYYSISFIDEEIHEDRTPIANLTSNTTEYHGILKMENLETHGNYLICVLFLRNETNLISSSRFCDVVSTAETCHLESSEETFGDKHVFVILGFVVFILLTTVIFTCIRDYIYRPRTIDALLKTLPEHNAKGLEDLAPMADTRRRRRTQQTLSNRLREDSVLTINYDPDADHDYFNYHAHDNEALDSVPE